MVDIHVYVHAVADPAIADKLDRIIRKIGIILKKEDKMSKELDDAVASLTASSVGLTSAVDSLAAFVVANADASLKLAAELESQGVDASKIREMADAQIANKDRIVALILANTPEAVPVPPAVPSV